MGLQREMAGFEQVDLRVRKVTLGGLGAGRNKSRIVPAPHCEKRRLVVPERGLKFGLERHIAAVVQDQVELDVLRTGPRHQGNA
jgi:hypothetical protein